MTHSNPSLPPLSLRAYARHRQALGLPGGDESTVRRAVRDGRVPPELLTAAGKVADPEAADRAWGANTDAVFVPLRGPTAPKRPEPVPVADSRPMICVDDQAVVLRYPLGAFLAGARAALREAGREPTSGALWGAVATVGTAGWWALIACDVTGRLDPAVPLDELRADWERAGRQAVTGEGGDDGAA